MARDIWVISDTHFSHSNILNFTNEKTGEKVRNFHSVSHMNEVMIENWNSRVKPGGYCLPSWGRILWGQRAFQTAMASSKWG